MLALGRAATDRDSGPDSVIDPNMSPMRSLRERVLANRRLVSLGQFVVTGELIPRRHRLLARAVADGRHDYVLDLGCGSAPMLQFVQVDRYVGVDGHEPSLALARRRRSGPGRDFVLGELPDVPLQQWYGADVVIVASVTHHLDSDAVITLFDRIVTEVAPERILLQDAHATGPLGPLVRALDVGQHLRHRDDLVALLEPWFSIAVLWTYENPLRSFHQFLLELRPAGA